MSKKIYVTRRIPESGIEKLRDKGHELVISGKDGVLTKEELITELKKTPYDAVLCLLTDKIDGEIFDAAGKQCKIFANYAVGYDNIDLEEARKRDIMITNTPGVLTETVAEHAFALMFAIARRIPEADRFTRAGKYKGWAPLLFLGDDISGKTIGIVGSGRIGSRVARHAARGFEAKIIYYDIKRNEEMEKDVNAEFKENLNDLLAEADFVSVHVPLLPTTKHLISAEQFNAMKDSAYLINTSRGPVVDELALYTALKDGAIRGAALDVFENEPDIEEGLLAINNVILTPHIASGTRATREKMSVIAADNLIEALDGRVPPNIVVLNK